VAAIILAAGKGTRMNSDLPKVAHEVAGRPMVWWVVRACRRAHCNPIILVVGFGAEFVRRIFAGEQDVEFADQDQQLGTGHATLCAEPALRGFEGNVVVLAGDGPLIRASTIQAMIQRHREAGAAATLATSVIKDPTGYGRIVRDGDGHFSSIIEHKNATPLQRQIREVYPSYACFDGAALFDALRRLQRDPVSGEYYLTEVPAMLKAQGRRVEVVDAVPAEDVLSINTPQQLQEVEAILQSRESGVHRSAPRGVDAVRKEAS
jgi:bifunctional UDP-N-acetylglucosamine pyrophosphorylase/glucosamine-1-phosphate N-acetyltransferase